MRRWGAGRRYWSCLPEHLSQISSQVRGSTTFQNTLRRASLQLFWYLVKIIFDHDTLTLLRRQLRRAGVGPGKRNRRSNDRKWRVDTSGRDQGRAGGNPEWFTRGERMPTTWGTGRAGKGARGGYSRLGVLPRFQQALHLQTVEPVRPMR